MRAWHPWLSPPGCSLFLEGEFVTTVAQPCTQPLPPILQSTQFGVIREIWDL